MLQEDNKLYSWNHETGSYCHLQEGIYVTPTLQSRNELYSRNRETGSYCHLQKGIYVTPTGRKTRNCNSLIKKITCPLGKKL